MKKSDTSASFAISLRKLSLAVKTSEEQAKSAHEAAGKARIARFHLIRDHIKAGGSLSEKQLALLSEPEKLLVKTALLAKEADIGKAFAEIEKSLVDGLQRTSKAFSKFFDGF